MRTSGFTLLELMLALVTVGILATIATLGYREYVERAQAAQTLVNIDHIATVVRIEKPDVSDIHIGAVPGYAPPRLMKILPDSDFRGRSDLTLWLIKAPAGTFASYPDRSTYGLVATVPSDEALRDLLALRRGLPHGAGDMPWIDPFSFSFPLEAGGSQAAPGPRPSPADPPNCSNGTSWGSLALKVNSDKTWSAAASVMICGGDGKPLMEVKGQVQFSFGCTVRGANGEVIVRSWSNARDLENGIATFTDQRMTCAGPTETLLSVSYAVTGVNYYYPSNPPVKWDGKVASITMSTGQ